MGSAVRGNVGQGGGDGKNQRDYAEGFSSGGRGTALLPHCAPFLESRECSALT